MKKSIPDKPSTDRHKTSLFYLALALLTAFAAIVSPPTAAQYEKMYGCPSPMRVFHVQLNHGKGITDTTVPGYMACLQRIDLKFGYGGPRNFDSLEYNQYVTVNGIYARQSDPRTNYGEEFDRMLSQGIRAGGKQDGPTDAFDLDTFTIRFLGNFYFNGGDYTFSYGSDDGIRVYIDGHNIIDDWEDQGFDLHHKKVFVPAGNHFIVVDFYENRSIAELFFDWSPRQ